MALAVNMLTLCPPELIPVVLTKQGVRCMFSAAVNKKHTLHQIALATLGKLAKAVGADPQCRLALASTLVQYGGVGFDSSTGTSIVSGLLEGLNSDALLSHIKFLCEVISSSTPPAPDFAGSTKHDALKTDSKESRIADGEGEDEDEDDGAERISSALAALEALVSLAKNQRLSSRGEITTTVLVILIRLACFSGTLEADFAINETGGKSKGKKKASGGKEYGNGASLSDQVLSAMELVAVNSSCPENLSNLAANRLMTILADMGSMTLSQLNSKTGSTNIKDGSNSDSNKGGPTLLDISVECISYYAFQKGLVLRRDFLVQDEDEGLDASLTGREALRQALDSFSGLKKLSNVDASVTEGVPNKKKKSSNQKAPKEPQTVNGGMKLAEAIRSLVCHSIFHTLVSGHTAMETLGDVAQASNILVSKENDKGKIAEAHSLLLDACMEMLSVPSDCSVKGVLKFNSYFQLCFNFSCRY